MTIAVEPMAKKKPARCVRDDLWTLEDAMRANAERYLATRPRLEEVAAELSKLIGGRPVSTSTIKALKKRLRIDWTAATHVRPKRPAEPPPAGLAGRVAVLERTVRGLLESLNVPPPAEWRQGGLFEPQATLSA
jgi:hypothetical protein